MKKILRFINSPIGGKIIMALSGGMIVFFLLFHALGNLLIFNSQSILNSYAHWLQHSPFLWVFRATMLILLGLHVFLALKIYFQNRLARPITYSVHRDIQLYFSSKSMMISGLVIFVFIIIHVFQLTLGWVSTTSLEVSDVTHKIDVYSNVVKGFQNPIISLFYLFSLFLIGLHLHHAIKSLFQTLGFHHENFHKLLDYLAPAFIIALIFSFMSIPIAVFFGLLK
jgi:succinate dehydrogenase / fumarate reductase, cytochrome b subunit